MPSVHLGVTIDYARNNLLTRQAKDLLTEKYCLPGEDIQEAFARACVAYATDTGHAQRLYDYVSKLWFMFSSPVLSNAPLPGEKAKGLPISCFAASVEDNLTSLIDHMSEVSWLAVRGGGVGGHWSDIRAVSKKAPGPIPFMQNINAAMNSMKQVSTRRGSYAAYLDVSHPDIEEFLEIRNPTGGDINRKCLSVGFHHAVNITDDFMVAVEQDLDWNLIDPDSKEVRHTLRARELWEKIITVRYRTGEPYLFFIDTANRALHPNQKKMGLSIKGSNLCNEITLPTNEERTFVCCLSSLNVDRYDEWKDTPIISDLIEMLDNVLQKFIDATDGLPGFERARFSAMHERSLGLGVMGLHSYFQRYNLPFGSEEARLINEAIFRRIREQADAATLRLGTERGEAPDMAGTGRRNSYTMAVAPNANSGMIVGCSPSIEPWAANAFTSESRIGTYLVKNPALDAILLERLSDTAEYNKAWKSIIEHSGSVQHLDCLHDLEKQVYLTSKEIDQADIIRLGADRQKHIDQGQSLNLFFPRQADKDHVSRIHYMGWKTGCKGLYYLRTEAEAMVDTVGRKSVRNALSDGEPVPKATTKTPDMETDDGTCESCQG